MEEIKASVPPLIANLRNILNKGCNGDHTIFSAEFEGFIDRVALQIGKKVFVEREAPKRTPVIPELHEIKILQCKIENSISMFNEGIDNLIGNSRASIEEARKLYRESKVSEAKRHEDRMAELISLLTQEKATFSERISGGKRSTMQSQERAQEELAAFTTEIHDYETHMNQQITELTNRNDADAESLRLFEASIAAKKLELEQSFTREEKRIDSESLEKAAQLEQEKAHLEYRARFLNDEYEPQIFQIQEQLNAKKQALELKAHNTLRDMRNEENTELETIKIRHETELNEANKKLLSARNSERVDNGHLRLKLLQITTELNKCEGEIARKLKRARLGATTRLVEKETDLKQARAEHVNEIECLEMQNNTEIATFKAKTSQIIAKLEHELIQCVCEVKKTHRKLEGEVERLQKEKPKQVKPPVSPSSPSPRRPKKLIPSVDFELTEAESMAMLNEMYRRKEQRESEIRAQRAKVRTKMQQLEELKGSYATEYVRITNSATPRARGETRPLSEREQELMRKVEMQKNTISQLRDDKEKQRVDISKRKALRAIQMHYKQLEQDAQQKMADLSVVLSRSMESMSEEMTEKLKQSRVKNAEMILDASKRLDRALAELNAAKKASESECMKEFTKWKELRTDIESSTKSLCVRAEAVPRPMSSVTKLNQIRPRFPQLNEA